MVMLVFEPSPSMFKAESMTKIPLFVGKQDLGAKEVKFEVISELQTRPVTASAYTTE